jgi:hypothetical protein
MTDTAAGAEQQLPATPSMPERLGVLVGTWRVEGSHRLLPGVTLAGRTDFAWLDSGAFLTLRSTTEHPDVPDSVMVIGYDDVTEQCSALYNDSRGVARIYAMSVNDRVWSMWRDAPGFAQRFTGVVAADGDTIEGQWELCRDGTQWEADLTLTYTRMNS